MTEDLEIRTELTKSKDFHSKLKLGGVIVGAATSGAIIGGAMGYISQLMIPSVIVNLNNRTESMINSVKKETGVYWKTGLATSYLSAISVMGYVMYDQISDAIQKASDGDYTHLGVLLATNLASSGLELFRLGHRIGKRSNQREK